MLATYLVIVMPISALATRRELGRRLDDGRGLRMGFYRQAISRGWLLAGVTIGVAGLARQPMSALGLRGPRLMSQGPAALVVEVMLLVIVATGIFTLAGRTPGRATAILLPRTRDERAIYGLVAVSAGVVEELLFRGFLMGYAMGGLGWSWQQASAASAVAFGVSHLYQGPATAAAATLIGFGFAESYTLTGSLLAPVLLHIALDLRVLTWPQPSDPQKCRGVSGPSSRSPVWNTRAGEARVPSPATKSRVGAVADA